MDELMRLAERLNTARAECGMTVEEAADAVGVEPGELVAYERAKLQPPVLTFRALAVAYEKSADWLLD